MKKPHYISVKEFLVNSPEQAPKGIFLLAHDVAKGMANPFLEKFAEGLVAAGLRVVRFNFPYIEDSIRSGVAMTTDNRDILTQSFSEVVIHCIEKERCPSKSIIIGGKGMGGRISTLVADEHKVAGVICLGYKFYPIDHPHRLGSSRNEHLKTIQTPTLICQGQYDPFGIKTEVKKFNFPKSIKFHWLANCDTNFKPGILSDRTQDENLKDLIRACKNFINQLL